MRRAAGFIASQHTDLSLNHNLGQSLALVAIGGLGEVGSFQTWRLSSDWPEAGQMH